VTWRREATDDDDNDRLRGIYIVFVFPSYSFSVYNKQAKDKQTKIKQNLKKSI